MSSKLCLYTASILFTGIVSCGAGDEPGLTYGAYRARHPTASWRDYATQTIRQAAQICRDSINAARLNTSPSARADAGFLTAQTTETETAALQIALRSKGDEAVDLLYLYRQLELTRRARGMHVVFRENIPPQTIDPYRKVPRQQDVRRNFAEIIDAMQKVSAGSLLVVGIAADAANEAGLAATPDRKAPGRKISLN